MKSAPDAFWKYSTFASLSLCLLLGLKPAGESKVDADVVSARRFLLLDSKGKAVGEWGSDSDYPKAVSLRMYDPQTKDGAATIRLMTVDGGVQLHMTGDPDSGGVFIDTSKGGATLSLLGTCTDASHTSPMRLGLVNLSVDGKKGSLWVARTEPTMVDGKHADGFETLLRSEP